MDTHSQPTSPAIATPNSEAPVSGRRPDPGSRTAALIALVTSCILVLVVFITQQMDVQDLSKSKPNPAVSSDSSIFSLYAKGFTKGFGAAFATQSEKERGPLLAPVVSQVDQMAQTPDEKLRAAIIGGELTGADKAVEMLEASKKWTDKAIADNAADPQKGFKLDEKTRAEFDQFRNLLLKHYTSKVSEEKGDGSNPVGLSDVESKLVRDHFGWFGRLADVYGMKDAPDRKALFVGGEWIIVMMVFIAAIIVGGLLAGVVLFIVALVMIARGSIERRFVAPLPGGSVYLETLAVFVLAFLTLKVGLHFAANAMFPKGSEIPDWFLSMHLGLQWLVALVPLYPLLRGVSFKRWRDDVGFVAPNGVFREIFFGILAYLAGVPIFVIGVVVSLALKFALEVVKEQFGGESGAPATNPIFDEIIGSNPVSLVLLVSLATIWAPFVEEAIFRGCTFRHLRSRTGLLIAAAVSAIVFGCMHGYEFVLLGPVISLGFIFALMREWRNSIIPSITAHMLHNGSVVIMAIIMIRLIAA